MQQIRTEPSVAFVGLGYVGLTTAACMASRKIKVLGIDTDEVKVRKIRMGEPVIKEQGLQELLDKALRTGYLELRTDYAGIAKHHVIIVSVGTPSKEDGGIDTEYVEAAAKEVGRQLGSARGYRLIVVKSTVTPGTTERLVRPILERESGKKVGKEIGLASNPEFLHEGSAIEETLRPDAIVIGGVDKRSSDTLLRVFEAFYRKLPPVILTSPSNAEMIKYAINAGRASQLSFVNTIANFCSRIPGCDYDEVRKGLSFVAKMDERYLAAGIGFGGSCLPKDARALAASLRFAGVSDEVVTTALKVNDNQVNEAIALGEKLCGALDGKRVSVLGLAFKAGTDDIRESVAISLIRALIKKGADISVYDPVAISNVRQTLGTHVTYAKSARESIRGSECAFVATGWDEFKRLRPKDFTRLMASPVVVDGRRIYKQAWYRKGGVRIATIGTGPVEEEMIGRENSGKAPEKNWHYVFGNAGIRESG